VAGLLEEDDEGRLAMEDAITEYKSASQLRFLFMLLIVEGTGAIELWDSFCDDLARDFLGNTFDVQPVLIREHAHNRALEKIDELLGEHGKSTTAFGLPAVKVHSAEVCTDLDYFGKQARELNSIANDFIDAMTPDQRAIYNILSADIFGNASSSTPLHFLMGKAGRGKSFIVKVLIAKAHGMGHIAGLQCYRFPTWMEVELRTACSNYRFRTTTQELNLALLTTVHMGIICERLHLLFGMSCQWPMLQHSQQQIFCYAGSWKPICHLAVKWSLLSETSTKWALWLKVVALQHVTWHLFCLWNSGDHTKFIS
jgi:hypothetical protein